MHRLTALCVICLQLIGDTGWKAFEKQVEAYNFKTSLFDTVVRLVYFFLYSGKIGILSF